MTSLKLATRQRAALSALLGVVISVAAPAAVPSAEHATLGESPRLLRIIKPVMVDVVRTVDLRSMSFEDAQMSADQVRALDAFLIELHPVSISAVIITGYADRIEDLNNVSLAERRAASVKDHMSAKGIDWKRIFWQGSGSNNPVAVTRTCPGDMERKQLIECLAPNRRVTIEVVGSMVKPPEKRPPRPSGV